MKVGMVGLGAMGAGMALNFHKHGLLHAIWNRSSARAAAVTAQTGVKPGATLEELAGRCELIVTCVSRDEDVIETVTRLAAAVRPGTIVADTSTVGRDTARQAAAILGSREAHFLDCPVSGGTEGAKNGTLAMMVGGDAGVLERARPALAAIARGIVLIGPVGSGQACKAVNQHMIAGIYDAVAEALAFGESMGLDMQRVIEVLSGGAAANWVLQNRGRGMLARSFPLGFKVSLHHKDLEICRRMAAGADGVELPIAERVIRDYEQLMRDGHGDEDVSALYRLKLRQHPKLRT